MIAFGTLSKSGHLGFLSCAVLGAISIKSYRRALLDRRIGIAVADPSMSLDAFFTVGALQDLHFVKAVIHVVAHGKPPGHRSDAEDRSPCLTGLRHAVPADLFAERVAVAGASG